LLVACGKSGPSEAELQRAIDAHLADRPKCIGEVGWQFPASVPTGETIIALMGPQFRDVLAGFEALERLGLVRGTQSGENTEYELTDTGRSFYREFPAGHWDPRKPVGAFCYGTAKVADIVRFTEPAEELGTVATTVTYAYRLTEVASWADDPELGRRFPYLVQELAAREVPREATTLLTLHNDGWRVMTLPGR
jgi:hypothetical protein